MIVENASQHGAQAVEVLRSCGLIAITRREASHSAFIRPAATAPPRTKVATPVPWSAPSVPTTATSWVQLDARPATHRAAAGCCRVRRWARDVWRANQGQSLPVPQLLGRSAARRIRPCASTSLRAANYFGHQSGSGAALARGSSAASRCMTVSGDITKCVVPSRHWVWSLSTTCSAALVCTRSFASAGRVMWRHSCL